MNSDKNTLTYHILLKTTDNAVKFVNTINTLDGYFDICMGSYFFECKINAWHFKYGSASCHDTSRRTK